MVCDPIWLKLESDLVISWIPHPRVQSMLARKNVCVSFSPSLAISLALSVFAALGAANGIRRAPQLFIVSTCQSRRMRGKRRCRANWIDGQAGVVWLGGAGPTCKSIEGFGLGSHMQSCLLFHSSLFLRACDL